MLITTDRRVVRAGRRPWRRWLGWWAAHTALLGAALLLWAWLDADANRALRDAGRRAVDAARNAWTRELARTHSQPARIELTLGAGGLQQLRADRDRALRQRFADSATNRWLAARLAFDGVEMRAEVRLKGALRDHWSHPTKWSVQVKLKGDDRLLGMRRFSLQHPATRSFLHEWLFARALRDEGCLAPRVEFVDVALEGRELGIFTLEGQPDRYLIEAQGHRDGPVVDLDKRDWLAYWRFRSAHAQLGYWKARWFYQEAAVEARGGPDTTPAAPLPAQAIALLAGFRSGALRASQVFDVEALARHLAVRAVMGSAELDWKDLPFHYNPLTDRLAPIGREVHFRPRPDEHHWWVDGEVDGRATPLAAQLFADHALLRRYTQHLERISQPEWLESLLQRHARELARNHAILAREFPDSSLPVETLRGLAHAVHSALRPEPAAVAHWAITDDRATLRVGNLCHFALRITTDGVASTGTRIPGRKRNDIVRWHDVPLGTELQRRARSALASGHPLPPVAANVDGLKRPLPVRTAVDRPTPLPAMPEAAAVPDLLARHTFLVHVPARNELHVTPGHWQLRRPLLIPLGTRLVAGPGVRLDLRDGAYLGSFSPVQLCGSADHPVVLHSTDGTGVGIRVDSRETSRFEHVRLRGLSASSATMPAALTIRGGTLVVRDLRIGGHDGRGGGAHWSDLDFRCDGLSITGGSTGLRLLDACGTLRHARLGELSGSALHATNSRVFTRAVAVESVGNAVGNAAPTAALRFDDGTLAELFGARIARCGKAVETRTGATVDMRDVQRLDDDR